MRITNPSLPPDGPRIVATFPRGKDEELRLIRDAYEGHPYLSLRLWLRDRTGETIPTRKGVSIRFGELAELIAALQRVHADAMASDAGSDDDGRP